MGGGIGRVNKHPDYYLSDGSVSFLCGGGEMGRTLFRVHKSFFERESAFFRNHFADAAKDDPHSGTDACPFTLDVKPEEFGDFLWVWYDREYSYGRQTKEKWTTILDLATCWEFPRIRELAIRELEALALPPAERIFIYTEHGIEGEELLSSCVEICKSPNVPTDEDGRRIPMKLLIQLLQAREDAQRKAGELGHESPTSACLEDETLREIVSKLLNGPGNSGLNPRSNGTSTGSGGQASDGEQTRVPTTSTSTIILGEPQVPDRSGQPASRPVAHPNNPTQTDGDAKGVAGKNTPGEAKGETSGESNGSKVGKPEQVKAKEEEKAKKDKERETREKKSQTEQKPSQSSRANL